MSEVELRFIAGKQPGHEFPLKLDQVVVIERADNVDPPIREDTISRKHAVISLKNDEIVLENCSQGGTCVNGQPVLSATLKPGDQIHVGHTILKVVVHDAPLQSEWSLGTVLRPSSATNSSSALPVSQPQSAAAPVVNPAPPPVPMTPRPQPVGSATTEHFRGSIADIALPDLLQLLTTTRKTGVLVLRSRDMIGWIHLSKGQICHATMDDGVTVNALKVFYRLLRWIDGTFELEPADDRPVPTTITETTDYLLLESMHQLDEINNLGSSLPPLHAEIVIANPLPAPLRDLAPGDLDFIQIVLRFKTVRSILDHYAGSDFQGYTYLKSLIGRHYLTVAES